MNRLYQWLAKRASFFRPEASGRGTTRTVRTEVTVERQGMTLLVADAAAAGFNICPLCGSKLDRARAEQAKTLLLEGSSSQEPGSG